jgi:uncharacterized protein (TIGR02145 family)
MKHCIHIVFVWLLICCKMEEPQNPPSVLTSPASNIKINSATLNGEIINEGYSAVTERGFVISEVNTNPSVSDAKFKSGYGKGPFSLELELRSNTKYYYKTYATNSKGTSYGDTQNFITKDFVLPTIKTSNPENISYASVDLLATLLDEGVGEISEMGFVLSTSPSPTISNLRFLSSNISKEIRLTIYQLASNTKFYIKSYVKNEKGVAYGSEFNFTTLEVRTVTSKTGRIWMDRNLGATQVAIKNTDVQSFGDLYQWGRRADGHQSRYSNTTTELSNSEFPMTNSFILSPNEPNDWLTTQNSMLWQDLKANTSVCPVGFRIPTLNEWALEMSTWQEQNSAGAINSVLKLPNTGLRAFNNGSIFTIDNGLYWCRDTDGTKSTIFWVRNDGVFKSSASRAYGVSVRCIKD